MSHGTLDEVLDLVTHLTPMDKARLITYIAPQVVQALTPEATSDATETRVDIMRETATIGPATAWAELARIGAELSAMGPVAVSSSDELAAMRR